jgi:hypothetical protein
MCQSSYLVLRLLKVGLLLSLYLLITPATIPLKQLVTQREVSMAIACGDLSPMGHLVGKRESLS